MIVEDEITQVIREIATLQNRLTRLRYQAKARRLSRMEARIAEQLVSGAFVSITTLMGSLKTTGESIRVHVHRIRRKMPEVQIETIHGRGYRIVEGAHVLARALEFVNG